MTVTELRDILSTLPDQLPVKFRSHGCQFCDTELIDIDYACEEPRPSTYTSPPMIPATYVELG